MVNFEFWNIYFFVDSERLFRVMLDIFAGFSGRIHLEVFLHLLFHPNEVKCIAIGRHF